jgi:hypothetical protein
METASDHVQRILDEGALGMAQAARFFGSYRSGRPTHPSTLTRWCLDGIRLRNGRRLRLEHIRIGERLLTSKAAVLRFLTQQQDASSIPEPPTLRSPAERKRANAKAEAELEASGIK